MSVFGVGGSGGSFDEIGVFLSKSRSCQRGRWMEGEADEVRSGNLSHRPVACEICIYCHLMRFAKILENPQLYKLNKPQTGCSSEWVH